MSDPAGSASPERLPYWQMNIPQAERTDQCPDFLLHVSDKDRGILSARDEDYRRSSWEEVKKIATRNDLAAFQRVPSDLRRYLAFKAKLVRTYGSVQNYMLRSRLGWGPSITPIAFGTALFTNPRDYRILWNDWPYGIDTAITHLVVWTKFELDDDPATGDIAPEVRTVIEDFVCRVFCDERTGGLPRERVIWFKNWASLKSVDAVEHFHVMLYKADREFVERVTNGDRPLSENLQELEI